MKSNVVDEQIAQVFETVDVGEFLTPRQVKNRAGIDVSYRKLVNSFFRLQREGILKYFGNGLVSNPDSVFAAKRCSWQRHAY